MASAAVPISRLADLSRWLVPALGCFLLVTATLSNRYSSREVLNDYAGTTFLAHADQAGEMFLARHPDHSDINNIPARRWEWRLTTPAVTPAIASIFFSYTNKSTTNE